MAPPLLLPGERLEHYQRLLAIDVAELSSELQW
jgi:hypothetical protein